MEIADTIRKRTEAAYKLYDEVKDVFDNPEKYKHMKGVLEEDVHTILEEFSVCFKNDPEKMADVDRWKLL